MEWSFDAYVLNVDRAELRGPDGLVHVERGPFRLLLFLIENADRLVTRDDLVEAIWDNRIVSEATISTTIKQARKAVGDSGAEQRIIKTIHGRGVRFVAPVTARAETKPAATPLALPEQPSLLPLAPIQHGAGQPGIAVMRFQQLSSNDDSAYLADGFPSELISGLSRVGWLRVIARGSSFQFDPAKFDPADVGRRLNVPFLLTGTIEDVSETIAVSLEIQSASTGDIVWSNRFDASREDVEVIRHDIVSSVIAGLELAIPEFEAQRSRRLSLDQFDAWSHFHLGLSHIFKFNSGDNLIAAEHFRSALDLDPGFARAHAGLSFAHWQNGFMFFAGDRAENQRLALQSAARAVEIDPKDPFSNFNMGRAQWLQGDTEGAQAWLDRATQINPNYAQCHYNKGLISALEGQADAAHKSCEKALYLSPLDPLAYGIFGVRAMSSMQEGDYRLAVEFAERGVRQPSAHVYIVLLAALARHFNGEDAAARRWRDHAISIRPDLSVDMFLAAFPYQDPSFRRDVVQALSTMGLRH